MGILPDMAAHRATSAAPCQAIGAAVARRDYRDGMPGIRDGRFSADLFHGTNVSKN
jgi:hypothetical protein